MRAEGGVLLDKPGSDDDDAWNNLRVVLKISSEEDVKAILELSGQRANSNERLSRIVFAKNYGRYQEHGTHGNLATDDSRGVFDRLLAFPSSSERSTHSHAPLLSSKRPLAYYSQLLHVSFCRVMDMDVISRDWFEITSVVDHKNAENYITY
ncbi:hypothetical protein V8E54_010397 [Elaphomyces granulatus]